MTPDTPLMAKARAALASVYGFSAFRPGQESILEATLGGEDVLAVMPTGSGKSLCFQLPPIVRDDLALVVSPLIALMRDQVAQLRELGVEAASLNSSSDDDERRRVARGLRDRTLRLLYIAPERLLRDDVVADLKEASIDLLAIDEAHCVSQWGHDFRPEYLRLREVVEALDGVQTIAVTATADAPTRAEIAAKLFVRPPRVFVRSFDRPNLFLAMRPKANATRQLIERLDAHRGESGIVYCASRRRTEDLALEFSRIGRRAMPYHAGLDHAVRARNQDAFLREDECVVCATIAFGMGIDKPDVRFVFHADMPSSIEAYYQEIGRAGRDGLPADAFTLYSAGDIELRRRQIPEGGAPDARKHVEMAKLDDLVALCETARCRRQTLLGMFGEELAPLRQLRRLPRRRPACRRARRCAEGAVGGVAHLGPLLFWPSGEHPLGKIDRSGAAARTRPTQDLRRRQGPIARRLAGDFAAIAIGEADRTGFERSRPAVSDGRRPARSARRGPVPPARGHRQSEIAPQQPGGGCPARRGRCLAQRAEGLAGRDRGGAEATGLCHFSGSDADRNGEKAPR